MNRTSILIIGIALIITIILIIFPNLNSNYLKGGKLYISEVMASNSSTIKDDNGDYSDYIDRIVASNNKDALNVKLADLNHNMDISRIKNPTLKDVDRIEKRYRPAYIKILNKLEEMK